MSTILYTGAMVFLWLIALLNGTGLGNAYHTTEYARILALGAAILLFLWNGRFRKGWLVPRDTFLTLVPMMVVFTVIPYLNGYGKVGLEYLWVFLIVYMLSLTRPTKQDITLAGLAYGGLGLAVLFIYNYMTALSGWNDNSIAMIGLFSFLVFTIPFYGIRNTKSMIMIGLVGAAYVFLIWPTDSRSCSIAIVLDLLIVFRVLPIEKMFRKKWLIGLALHIPLIIALLGCIVAANADMDILNTWSAEEFGKTFFSGREGIWKNALSTITSNLLLGTGFVDSGNYHNSAIACLVGFGVVGYIMWIASFKLLLKKTLPYWDDVCVAGAISAFFVIFWQQSVELGLFSTSPNLIPYVVLGTLLGRAAVRKEQECQELV